MAKEKFPVSKESITTIQEYITSWCDLNEISLPAANKISICSDEIISNIIFYSNATFLEIEILKESNILSVTFTDNGKPFNPLTDSVEPDINAGVEERQIGGLGIFIVKKMMTDVAYSRTEETNVLKMSLSC